MTPRHLVGGVCCGAFVLALTTPHWFALTAAILMINAAVLASHAWENRDHAH